MEGILNWSAKGHELRSWCAKHLPKLRLHHAPQEALLRELERKTAEIKERSSDPEYQASVEPALAALREEYEDKEEQELTTAWNGVHARLSVQSGSQADILGELLHLLRFDNAYLLRAMGELRADRDHKLFVKRPGYLPELVVLETREVEGDAVLRPPSVSVWLEPVIGDRSIEIEEAPPEPVVRQP